MIIHKYKCIFIHQRKNAGTSIIQTLGSHLNESDKYKFNDGCYCIDEIDQIKYYKNKGYTVFCVCRNPWNKVVSGFSYLKKEGYLENECTIIQALQGKKQLLQKGQKQMKNRKERIYCHLLQPQCDLIIDENGDSIVDCILCYENLNDDFKHFCKKYLNIDNIELPVMNKTPHKKWKEFYDEDTNRIVKEIFKKDIEYFNYQNDGPF
jgi:hypothetical protein